MNNGLRSDYVEKIGKMCLKNDLQVLPCDFFYNLNKIHTGQSFILNLDPSHEKGSHNVGLYIQDENVLYFDPIGLPCVNRYIINGLRKHGQRRITYSLKTIQGGISFHCAFFVLSFHIVCASQEKSFDYFLRLFSNDDFQRNELIAIELIKRQLKSSH